MPLEIDFKSTVCSLMHPSSQLRRGLNQYNIEPTETLPDTKNMNIYLLTVQVGDFSVSLFDLIVISMA